MIRPSRFPLCGKNHLGWKSQLHQRKGLYVLPWTQYIDILASNATNRTVDPGTVPGPTPSPPSPGSYLTDLASRSWTLLDSHTSTDTVPYITRRLQHYFPSYYIDGHEEDHFNYDITDYHFANAVTEPPNPYLLTWPSLPHSIGTDNQFANGGQHYAQCAYWGWFNGYDSFNTQYLWELCLQKVRYRYTIDSWGFSAYGDLYANKLVSGVYSHGWDSASTGGWQNYWFSRITIENIHLITSRTSVAPMTWIETAAPSGSSLPDTFANGFIGRLAFSIDFETVTQFTARTGLVVS